MARCRWPDPPLAVDLEPSTLLCLVGGRGAVEEELFGDVPHRCEVSEGQGERPAALPACDWTRQGCGYRHQCRSFHRAEPKRSGPAPRPTITPTPRAISPFSAG